jgi:hypothetical protein
VRVGHVALEPVGSTGKQRVARGRHGFFSISAKGVLSAHVIIQRVYTLKIQVRPALFGVKLAGDVATDSNIDDEAVTYSQPGSAGLTPVSTRDRVDTVQAWPLRAAQHMYEVPAEHAIAPSRNWEMYAFPNESDDPYASNQPNTTVLCSNQWAVGSTGVKSGPAPLKTGPPPTFYEMAPETRGAKSGTKPRWYNTVGLFWQILNLVTFVVAVAALVLALTSSSRSSTSPAAAGSVAASAAGDLSAWQAQAIGNITVLQRQITTVEGRITTAEGNIAALTASGSIVLQANTSCGLSSAISGINADGTVVCTSFAPDFSVMCVISSPCVIVAVSSSRVLVWQPKANYRSL